MNTNSLEIEIRGNIVKHAKLCQQVYIKLKRQIFQLPLPDEVDKIVLQYVGLRPHYDKRHYMYKRVLKLTS